MQHHSKHRRWIISFVIAIVVLTVATPVLAQYIGPKRTVNETYTVCKIVLNECRYVEAKAEWRYKTANSWSCSLESKPWQSYSSQSRACNQGNSGYQYWSREEETKTRTVTYPPATISSSLTNCTLRNGWCITVPQLSMQGLEPVAGYQITAIEGALNGQNFACLGSGCSVPLQEGNNNFTFWALSSFPTFDSSEMGTFSTKVDSQRPTITGSLSGPQGRNGWYLGPVTFNGSAADAASGVDEFTCRRDGILLAGCNMIPVAGDGPHDLVFVARDFAGHTRGIRLNVSIDSKDPTLAASINGTLGSNSWYTAATLNASTTDPVPGSGIFGFIYNLDGIRWVRFPTSGTLDLPDGKHTVDVRAVDNAGHVVTSSASFWLDTQAPGVNLDSAGTFGSNNWYITSPTVTASASDDTSGLDILEYSLDNSAWTTYTTPLSLDDGIHSVSVWAQDQAGLVTQVDRTYQVDTRAPQITGSLSGTPGMNGWYISDVTVSASASDPLPGSDIDTFTYTVNGSTETPYTGPVLLADGQHTLQIHARDNAGLSSSIEQSFKVDATPPSATIDTALPNWVKGIINLNGTVGDEGSGLSSAELSLDGGQTWQPITSPDSWNVVWDTTSSPNGVHEIRLRAADQAGLTTEQTVNVGVDYQSPAISLPDSWFQWDTVTFDISDEHSGLSEARVEISDPQGRWPARVIQLDPALFPLQFKWDRRFADGTIAEAGTYDVKVFAADRVGNTADKTASIRVLLEILPPGPTSTQPSVPTTAVNTATPILSYTATPVSTATATKPSSSKPPANTVTPVILVFGTMQPPVQATATPAATATPRATPTQSNVVSWMQSVFVPVPTGESTTEIVSTTESKPAESKEQSASTNNSVLWGTAATAAITALTAYMQEEKRKREEEQARLKALEEAKEERRQKMKERKTAKMEAKRAQEAAWEAARQEAWEEARQETWNAHIDTKMERLEERENKIWEASQAVIQKRNEEKRAEKAKAKARELQAKLQAYYAAIQPKKEEEAVKPEPSWWEKAIGWVDDHQSEISLGIGIAVGATVVILTAGMALPLVAAGALMVGATVTAGATVAAGTIALNKYYERPWNENLLNNVVLAGGAAAVVSGAGFVFQAASGGISSYCALHPSTCARVEPVFTAIDKVEETWLRGKLAVQTWRGNETGAFETAFELQTEYIDGGMPGNAVFRELGEQATHLSKNAAPLITKYGSEVIPLLVKHGDEGIQLIQKFGLDGIALLQKHGNDATDLVHLDPDVLEYVMQQGDDAVAALSRWSAAELREHGLELALRAKKDAEVLASIKELTSSGPVDPNKLTAEQKALIEKIAANSTQYAENGQVVLGKWVDISNGFVQTAQETGSVHYNPHPDMWTMLGRLGEAKQEEVAWLVNKQVVQNGIAKGLPFEYTLNGIPSDVVDREKAAIRAIFSGKSDVEIMKFLKSDYMPVRMKELQELQKAGYEFTFDNVNKSYILVKK